MTEKFMMLSAELNRLNRILDHIHQIQDMLENTSPSSVKSMDFIHSMVGTTEELEMKVMATITLYNADYTRETNG